MIDFKFQQLIRKIEMYANISQEYSNISSSNKTIVFCQKDCFIVKVKCERLLVLVMVVTAIIIYYNGHIFIQIVDLKELIAHEQTYDTDYTISSEGIYLVYQKPFLRNMFHLVCDHCI